LRSLGQQAQQLFDELAKESGVKEVKDTIEKDIMLIKGDDGQFYEAYDVEKTLLATQAKPETKVT